MEKLPNLKLDNNNHDDILLQLVNKIIPFTYIKRKENKTIVIILFIKITWFCPF